MSTAAAAPLSVEGGLVGQLVDWQLSQPVDVPRMPVAHLTAAQKAAALVRLQRQKAMAAAYEAELILGLAADRPDTLGPPAGTPGARSGSWAPDGELPGVSEFFVPELAVTLNTGRLSANLRAVRAWTWQHVLTGTFARLRAGLIDEIRAGVLADVLGAAAPEVARRVEARLLDAASSLSVGRLRARAMALLVELDPAGTDARRRTAERRADVRVHPAPSEGMSTLAADLPTPTRSPAATWPTGSRRC